MQAALAQVTTFRPMKESDVIFIKDSWLKSYFHSRYAGEISNNLYKDVTNDNIDQLWGRGATVEVACASHNPDKILGWACTERLKDGSFASHYVYCKDPYRRKGLATALLERAYGRIEQDRVQERPARRFYSYRSDPAWIPDFYRGFIWAPEVARRA